MTRPSQLMRSDQMQTLAEELSQGVRVVVNSELTHLVLRLDEQQLGRIAVDLVRQEHTVTAQFRVESPETMALLEASFGELRSLLGEQGVQIGELTVALDQGQREAPHHPAEETWIDREVPTGERIASQVAEGRPKGPRMFGYNTMELTA
ncbi:MAG: flagellar hook-length control protein FliK [candidate division KSB1 bacterium]|nr:flagellar hook-length control protein FliK [candidate division KSB1 bacterium]